MKIATWNVNSVRARLEHLEKYLGRCGPDVLCLQETKVVDEDFPREVLEATGYACHFAGQKSYNGVAILTKLPAEDVQVGFPHLGEDHPLNAQKRLISATIGGVRVICGYLPNGEAVGSDKFTFKLDFFRELRGWLDEHHDPGELLLLCGDFNVCAEPIDLHNPEEREGLIPFSKEERDALASLRDFGLADCFRHFHPEGDRYSWWDYRGGGYWKNMGMRIDYLYATAPLLEKCTDCDIYENPRRWKKPSDHTVVWGEFDI